ncbi:hypothetical protein, partial [Plasmodium yoelii yoelii]
HTFFVYFALIYNCICFKNLTYFSFSN